MLRGFESLVYFVKGFSHMKRVLVLMLLVVASIAILVAGLFGLSKLSKSATGIGATSIQSQELPVAKEFISTERYGSQMTTFVVTYEDEEYTLPQVLTSLVRTYSEGDTLPVTVYTYSNGYYTMQVDLDALKAANDESES